MKPLSTEDIIRAWRDRDFYLQLDEAQRASLPAHPSGLTELSDTDLESIYGGYVAGTHYSHCDPTADWCDDCKSSDSFEHAK